MTFDEFTVLAKSMRAVYTDPRFLPDEESALVWYALLQDIEYPVASKALTKYMVTNKWPPTPADIRGLVVEQTASPEDNLNEQEAWALVSRALRNSGYGFQEEFDALPEAVQKAVGTASNLHEWCMISDPSSLSVVQSQFQRAYRQVAERRKSDAAIPVLSNLNSLMGERIERIGEAGETSRAN